MHPHTKHRRLSSERERQWTNQKQNLEANQWYNNAFLWHWLVSMKSVLRHLCFKLESLWWKPVKTLYHTNHMHLENSNNPLLFCNKEGLRKWYELGNSLILTQSTWVRFKHTVVDLNSAKKADLKWGRWLRHFLLYGS